MWNIKRSWTSRAWVSRISPRVFRDFGGAEEKGGTSNFIPIPWFSNKQKLKITQKLKLRAIGRDTWAPRVCKNFVVGPERRKKRKEKKERREERRDSRIGGEIAGYTNRRTENRCSSSLGWSCRTRDPVTRSCQHKRVSHPHLSEVHALCSARRCAHNSPSPPSFVHHPFPLFLPPSLSRPGHPSFSRPSFFLHPARLPPQLPLSPRFPRVFLPLYFSPRSRFSSFFCSSLSLSLGLSIRVYALFTRRFLSRSFLDRRQLLSLSPSRSISVVTPDLSLFLSLFLSVCHSRCISTLPPMRIGSPFFEFRGTTHAWYRHRRGTFLDFRLRLRWTGRERGINARPRSIFRHPSPGRPRRCVEWFVSSG